MKRKEQQEKFRVGQVVAIRKGYMREGQYFRITSFRMGKDVMHAEFGEFNGAAVFAIRALTRREAGRG